MTNTTKRLKCCGFTDRGLLLVSSTIYQSSSQLQAWSCVKSQVTVLIGCTRILLRFFIRISYLLSSCLNLPTEQWCTAGENLC